MDFVLDKKNIMQATNFSIASVSLDTGIAKEVLRKWETRYGFPTPLRDALGNRLYSSDELDRLRLIKRLMDGGMRPAQVVPLAHVNLLALVQRAKTSEADCRSNTASRVIAWLQQRDPVLLRQNLQAELLAAGLEAFITDGIPSMNSEVGDAWERGEIAVRDEHLYSEIIQELLRGAIAQHADNDSDTLPRVLVTTPVGELHTLGVLMLQAFLSSRGASCLSLGAQTPAQEIGHAADDYCADIVGLSFSPSFPKRRVAAVIKEVRALVAPEKELWVGGQGVTGFDKNIRGVRIMRNFAQVEQALERYRSASLKHPRELSKQ